MTGTDRRSPDSGGASGAGTAALQRHPDALDGAHVDMAIVGGGIFGVCIAWDAALRGLDVALVERGDFGHATSANHFKVVHGGIRYLQHLDITRVRKSCRERSALLRIAPHLVEPIPILMPAFGHGRRGKGVLRVGFRLYDLLTSDRNRGVQDAARRIPSSSHLSTHEVREAFPGLRDPELTGGSVFYDGQIYNAPRLTLAFVKSAAEEGAQFLNYAEVEGFSTEGRRVKGIEVRDRLTNRRLHIGADVVINAAGPWAQQLLRRQPDLLDRDTLPDLTFSRDVAMVVRQELNSELGLAVPLSTRDADAVIDRGGRHLFLLPWRGRTLVGVWHRVHDAPPDRVEVSAREIDRYLQEVNQAYGGFELDRDDICHVQAGLVLFGDAEEQPDDGHAFGKRSVVVDHRREHDLGGLVTVVGVRATAARGVAAEAVNVAARQLDGVPPPPSTEARPLCGGRFDSFASLRARIAEMTGLDPTSDRSLALAHNYGSEFPRVWALCDEDDRLKRAVGGSTVTRAEIVHAARREMAVTLQDVVLRRTELGTACPPSEAELTTTAELLAEELGWDDGRTADEIEATRKFFREHGASRNYDDTDCSPLPAG